MVRTLTYERASECQRVHAHGIRFLGARGIRPQRDTTRQQTSAASSNCLQIYISASLTWQRKTPCRCGQRLNFILVIYHHYLDLLAASRPVAPCSKRRPTLSISSLPVALKVQVQQAPARRHLTAGKPARKRKQIRRPRGVERPAKARAVRCPKLVSRWLKDETRWRAWKVSVRRLPLLAQHEAARRHNTRPSRSRPQQQQRPGVRVQLAVPFPARCHRPPRVTVSNPSIGLDCFG